MSVPPQLRETALTPLSPRPVLPPLMLAAAVYTRPGSTCSGESNITWTMGAVPSDTKEVTREPSIDPELEFS